MPRQRDAERSRADVDGVVHFPTLSDRWMTGNTMPTILQGEQVGKFVNQAVLRADIDTRTNFPRNPVRPHRPFHACPEGIFASHRRFLSFSP
jgi:hypothetical protein